MQEEKLQLTDSYNDPFRNVLKIYNDGNHFVGTKWLQNNNKNQTKKMDITKLVNRYFDEMYHDYYVKMNEPKNIFVERMKIFINENFSTYFENTNSINEYIIKRMTDISHNVYSRIKRLKRKANLNNWNYFITITYDSNKMTEYAFRTKLKKCLSNLSTRRKWRYMGVFEYSPIKHRLHFHAIVFIPKNEMLGELNEVKDYSTEHGKIQTTMQNTFFAEKFGRNDFQEINPIQLKHGDTINYITKYLCKTNEYINYSRNIPSELYADVSNNDIVMTYTDFCVKYILFDDVIDSDYNYKPFMLRQMSMDDLE